jgi:hypothetical protein
MHVYIYTHTCGPMGHTQPAHTQPNTKQGWAPCSSELHPICYLGAPDFGHRASEESFQSCL